ncbi:hypothetical protein [Streptomyces spiralis]|uniref:hypothetical protein n=1 Tax=Streptomyces spiralis TaxID=66376 RepID=UPI003F4D5408
MLDRKWRSPSGAAEDGNGTDAQVFQVRFKWRSPTGAAEDRNHERTACSTWKCGGGCPPGRPRIATPSSGMKICASAWWRSPSRAAEDRNADSVSAMGRYKAVAVALRGGRGSQLHARRGRRHPEPVWRSPSEAAENRNDDGAAYTVLITGWRSSSGAAEDRNIWHHTGAAVSNEWRSTFGAAEDRNLGDYEARERLARQWRSPSGAAEDRNGDAAKVHVRWYEWRSPSGAAEDRNRNAAAVKATEFMWRSPSGAAEDRNPKSRWAVEKPSSSGGRPPGRPRIATTVGSAPSTSAAGVAVAFRGGRGSQP